MVPEGLLGRDWTVYQIDPLFYSGPFAKDSSIRPLLWIEYAQKHICRFKYAMGLVTNEEAVLYKAFPSTLSDKTLTWFASLKPRTIDSWRNLEKSFLDKFSTTEKIPKTRGDFANIKQNEGETLLAYLERFRRTYNEIEEISQDTSITCFEGGFCLKMLFTKLHLREPETIGEVFNVSRRVTLAEDSARSHGIEGRGVQGKLYLETKREKIE